VKKVAITSDMAVEDLIEQYPEADGFLMSRGIMCMR